MACKCFKRIKTEIDEQLTKQFNPVAVDESDFDNRVFVFEKGDFCDVMLPFRFRYIKRKVNGLPGSRITNGDTKVAINFCPFCGEKFKGKDC